jgi:tRNA(Arg) A34 adenosine deaminase TadA
MNGIELAKKIAVANDQYPKWSLGACVIKGGSVQAVGWNIKKSDPAFLDVHSNCSVHAEIHALKQMRFRAKGCVVYIARWRKGGGFGLAKPCANCQEVIAGSGVKRVVFTIDDHTTGTWRP